MKGNIPVSLALADVIDTPAVSGVSIAEYIAVLRNAVPPNAPKTLTSINAFERWLETRSQHQHISSISESVFADWANDLKTGKCLSISEKTYSSSFAQQATNETMRIHNHLVGKNPVVVRRLVNLRSYPRLLRFKKLTVTTQKAMVWYEREGRKASHRGCKGTNSNSVHEIQTEATRSNAISEAFLVLDVLKVNGLELISATDIEQYLGDYNPSSESFRRRCGSLRALKSLFRSCCDQGLLPINPLCSVPSNTFPQYSKKDFIVPADLMKIRDLSTVDFSNSNQVIGRMVTLCYADFAVRQNELSSLNLSQTVLTMDSAGIYLGTDNQKMHGKMGIELHPYYPETVQMLKAYLKTRKGESGTSPLFLNARGERASGETLAKMVKAECSRLGICCYYQKQRHPSPHDLRRTFGLCNISPIGCLDIFTIARRLRDSVAVAERHYVHNNPLLESMKAAEFRKQNRIDSSITSIWQGVELLRGAMVPEHLLQPIIHHADMHRSENAMVVDFQPSGHWVNEDYAIESLSTAWSVMPSLRTLRACLRAKGLAVSNGLRGCLRYDAEWVATVAKNYVPLSQIVEPLRLKPRQVYRLAAGIPSVIRIGQFILVRKTDSSDFVQKALKLLPNDLCGGKTSEGRLVKSA